MGTELDFPLSVRAFKNVGDVSVDELILPLEDGVFDEKDFGDKNAVFSSPYSNSYFEHSLILDKFHEKVDNCGVKTFDLVGYPKFNHNGVPTDGSMVRVELPVYCNNRSCSNEGCKKHRADLFKREHQPQITFLKESIISPKSYVFTGYNIPIYKWSVDFIRMFCRNRFLRLFSILKRLSLTEFSVHMELKLYNEDDPKYGYAYLHFHVVSGYIDIGKARSSWHRTVKYEYAIKMEYLESYMSKYASKTPYFETDVDRDIYHLVVYKSYMHRYSIALSKCDRIKREREWYIEDLLEREVYRCLRKRVLREGGYSGFVDRVDERRLIEGKTPYEPPPDDWGDLKPTYGLVSHRDIGLSKRRHRGYSVLDGDCNYAFEVVYE